MGDWKFFKAIRSAVVAHPVGSSQHRDYGFDGSRICIDIRSRSFLDASPMAKLSRLRIDGIEDAEYVRDEDVVLATYSTDSVEKGKLHFQRVFLDMADVRDVAELYVDALYELDQYVAGLKMRDFR